MRKSKLLLFLLSFILLAFSVNWVIGDIKTSEREKRAQLKTYVDNNGYWIEKAKEGLTVLNPEVKVPSAIYKGSKIKAASVITEDSPDVPVVDENSSTQSENSIFVDPNSNEIALNSNNSTSVGGPPLYGADYLYTFDIGETWGGSYNGAGGSNSGDPAACIGTDGRWYVGMISNSGQAVAYSDDQGESWTKVQVAPNPGSLADKNHMWIDTKEGSPYENYLYNSWTDFGGTYNNQVVLKRSTDNGESWGPKVVLSQAVNAGNHNQGVNISTGPNGEVYAVWTIYDNWPSDEDALGFARSFDGGETWEDSYRIINNIRGIRNTGVPQNMRVNAFPSMAVDCSDGSNSGAIYVVWSNVGEPGINTGNDTDIYMIKSTDDGDTWSDPIRVNQDETGKGKTHYMPWVAVDATSGTASVIFYDNRNVNNNQAEAWVANSSDGGNSWEDFRVSDVAFTPVPIPGMANGYFGDYLGIHAVNGKVYPVWTDNRSGHAMTYVSVFETLQITSPFDLQASVDQETGEVSLTWEYTEGTGFQNFRVYRDENLIEETNELSFTETLLNYGYYNYQVTAYYGGDNESTGPLEEIQYGSSTIEVIPGEYVANVYIDGTQTQQMKIKNTGVLDLEYSLSPFFPNNSVALNPAKGGGDEYINRVEFANIDNRSAYNPYTHYKDSPGILKSKNAYEIKVHTANAYAEDVCYVWIDLNANSKFDESPVKLESNDDNSLFYGIINIEKGSAQGITNMRVRLSADRKMNALEDTEYGETEDYTLLIADWLSIDPEEAIIEPGDSLMVALNFDATDLEQGVYNDQVKLRTNDLNNPFFNIPVTMNVTDLQITASADPETICVGESTSLMANPVGGSGTYTYSWISIPDGFTSDEQNPLASPEVNTSYIVSVNDGIIIMTDTVDITVNEVPVVNLGDDQILCGEIEYTLDAGNEGASYLWSTGDETQTIVATGSGEVEFWVDVTNAGGCTSRDEIVLTFADYPVVDIGADTTLCGKSNITLNAANEGSSYLWSTGDETQTIVVDTAGFGYGVQNISVVVTSPYGCDAEDEIAVDFLDCTGINENAAKVEFSVYPNPGDGLININFNSISSDKINIRIIDLSGKVVYSEKDILVNSNLKKQINLRNSAKGVYSIFVEGDGYVLDKKVVIK
ncbi:MAG: hypothetical protein C0595_01780 [Marinilabiliales bacterium]|nr:MAG: hypothetical protein C0595_01780 [Marinilabiliales bacterium]